MKSATYVVALKPAERQALEAMLKKGRRNARELVSCCWPMPEAPSKKFKPRRAGVTKASSR